MNHEWLESIPEERRENAREAIVSAFGAAQAGAIAPVFGGASGALTYRMEVGGRAYLLRMETRRSPLRNPHQYACMQIAAEAGIAPAVRYVDDPTGVAIMDFVAQRSLEEYPGGPMSLAAALGKLAAQVQATAAFPALGDYRSIVERIWNYSRTGFAAGLLEPHLEAFERIRVALPWDASKHVSSHNDPNPRNILFDGERLWLIDWEGSYRNDPLTDVAILSDNHAQTPELETVLLESWMGRAPKEGLRARLLLMRQLTRLWYAGILLASSASSPASIQDLAAPSPDEFRAMIATGQMKAAAPETRVMLGKMMLAGFRAELQTSGFEKALNAATL